MTTLTLAQAQEVCSASLRCAQDLSVAVAVAVVDDGGNPVLVARGDGANFFTCRMAQSKAVTAAGTGAPTADLAKALSVDPTLFTAMATNPDVTLVGGGMPLVAGGAVVGAVGVSGGTNGEDAPIAEAGVSALAARG